MIEHCGGVEAIEDTHTRTQKPTNQQKSYKGEIFGVKVMEKCDFYVILEMGLGRVRMKGVVGDGEAMLDME